MPAFNASDAHNCRVYLPLHLYASGHAVKREVLRVCCTLLRGILAEEEEKLYRLRQEKEGEARKKLLEEKDKLEEESRQSMVGMTYQGLHL